jgi:hypothetical protein
LRPLQHRKVNLTTVGIPQFICQRQTANNMTEPYLGRTITSNEHILQGGSQVTEPVLVFLPMQIDLCNGLLNSQVQEID